MKGRALFLLAVALLSYALFSFRSDFPAYYHVNEPDKGKQILSGERDFLHPLLLLTATDAVSLVAGRPHDMQQAVERGRLVSRTFAAVAVTALAAVGLLLAGWPGGIAVAAFAGTSFLLFEAAHYMKEDATFAMGASLVLLALVACRLRPSAGRAAALGAACGVAISAKYVGVALVPPALGLLWLVPRAGASRARRLALFAAALLVAVAALNYRVLLEPSRFRSGVSYEVSHGVQGALRDVTVEPRPVPHTAYRRNVAQEPRLVVLLALVGAGLALHPRTRRPGLGLVALFPAYFLLVVSCSPLHSKMYFIPVDLGLRALAGLGAAGLLALAAQRPAPRLATAAAAGLTLLAAADSVRLLAPRVEAFRHDTRAELRDWLAGALPAEAVVAQDGKVRIPSEGDWRFEGVPPHRPQRVLFRRNLSEWGSLAALREAGVTHVIVAADNVQRFNRAVGASAQHRSFYEEIARTARPVWRSTRQERWDTILNPDFVVYELAPPAGEAPLPGAGAPR